MFLNLFNKKSYDLLVEYFTSSKEAIQANQMTWLAMAINDRTLKESFLTKEVVLFDQTNNPKKSRSLQMAKTKDGLYLKSLVGTKSYFDGTIEFQKQEDLTMSSFGEMTDLYIELELNKFKEALNQGEFNPKNLESEQKALEWMRVSFEVLKKAVVESLTKSELLFQCKIFMGVNPQTKLREIRIINFNLDVTAILLNDNNLRVIIYNRKPGIELKDLKPALIGDYSLKKREIFDHIIELLSLLSTGVKA